MHAPIGPHANLTNYKSAQQGDRANAYAWLRAAKHRRGSSLTFDKVTMHIFNARKLQTCAIFIIVTFILPIASPNFSSVIKRRHNPSALSLSLCKQTTGIFVLICSEHMLRTASLRDLNSVDRKLFNQITGFQWIDHGNILVTKRKVTIGDTANKSIFAICDKPLDDGSFYIFTKPQIAHSIAYTDGSTELLSVAEFQKLNLDDFISVATIADY